MEDIASLISSTIMLGFTTGLQIGFTLFFINWIASTVFKLINRTV